MSIVPVGPSPLQQKLHFHGESISASDHVKQEVQRNETRSFTTSASALATSAFGTPAVIFVGSLSMGLPGIVAVANGFMGFVLGSHVGLRVSRMLEKPARRRTVKEYVPVVAEWLKVTYDVSFPTYTIEDITEIILGSLPNTGFSFTDKNTGNVFILKETFKGWVLQDKASPYATMNVPLEAFSSILGEYPLESMKILLDARRKTAALQAMQLTVEEHCFLQQIEKDIQEALTLVGQLKKLKEPEYLTLLNTSLTVISSRLDDMMKHYRGHVRKQILSKAAIYTTKTR